MKLAFTGIAGSGKDYLVNYLVQELNFKRMSFSDQLKKLAHKIYPWLDEDVPPYKKETPLNLKLESGEIITKTPREIWLSLNSLRDVENTIFVRMLKEELKNSNYKDIVISDIRPRIEWDWCQKNEFKTIYIEPKKKIYAPNDFDKQVLEYKDKADFIFENNFNGIDEFKYFIKKELGELCEN